MVDWDGARYEPGTEAGHYESWFVRATDPEGKRAFWIRYTIFSPRGRGQDAVGELWAVAYDRAAHRVVAAKQVTPVANCAFARDCLNVTIGDAQLSDRGLRGSATANARTIRWDLEMACDHPPIRLLPSRLYSTPIPRAKSVVTRPLARFTGTIDIDGTPTAITHWLGSQNHNWGSRHTDRYAWGQVAGFDGAPDVFLECGTARLKLGPVWTPPLSPVVLRLGSETLVWNSVVSALRARSSYAPFHWHLQSAASHGHIELRISASAEDVVALRYRNPPGDEKICLNTNIARCELALDRPRQPRLTLQSSSAAFEILVEQPPPGFIPVV